MGKDENVTRVDVRVPMAMYERIEVLAEKTNQPFTPKTKNTDNPKRIVTPIILKLVELGLKAIDEDSSKLDEDLVTPDIDNSETIENRLFKRLTKKLEVFLDELIENKLGDIEVELADIIEEQLKAVTPEVKENKESAIENSSEIVEVKSDVVNEDVSALEVSNDDTEVKEDNSEGLSMGKLAERFKNNKNKGKGASKTTISSKAKELNKEEFITWSKEQDPEGKAWYLNEADKLFYLVN